MKQLYSNQNSVQELQNERGIYLVFLALLILALIAVYGLVLDGSKLILSRLWAQRAADAATISGAGMIARDPLAVALSDGVVAYNPNLDIPQFSKRVARVALHNLSERNILATDNDANTTFTTILEAGVPVGTRAISGPVMIDARLANSSVTTRVRFLNEFILMDMITKNLGLDVEAFAEANVGSALVAIVLDTSNSMNEVDSSSGELKIERLKVAAKKFLNYFDQSQDRIGIFALGSNAKIVKTISRNPASGFDLVDRKQGINGLSAGGATNLAGALLHVYQEFDEIKSALPTWYNAATTSVLVFTDGAPTATTVSLSAMGALQPNTHYDDYKIIFSGSQATGPLLPFRMVRAGVLPFNAAGDSMVSVADIEPCSVLDAGWYSAAGSISGCANTLGFSHPAMPGQTFYPNLAPGDFEALFSLSAIAYADILRDYPQRSAPASVRQTIFYTIGLGDTDEDCNAIGVPYANAKGGDCADYRKDNLMARIAFDSERISAVQAQWRNPFPGNGLNHDNYVQGNYYVVPKDNIDLDKTFEQAAQAIRMRLVQ